MELLRASQASRAGTELGQHMNGFIDRNLRAEQPTCTHTNIQLQFYGCSVLEEQDM